VIVAGLHRVRVGDPDRAILREASFDLHAGERVALIGANGAGKSTLLRVLLGLVPPAEGTVQRTAAGVGYVPQGYAESLFPWFSVLRNIAMPRLVTTAHVSTVRGPARGRAVADAYETARALAKRVLPDVDPVRRAGRLSGGEKQATALARALASRGDLVIADEPFSAISASSREHLRHVLREELRGRALLLVTHDAADAADLCDRTVRLAGGHTVECSS
jgi:ABC-type nitrate/sulfonate/bicarbonate transport system ATPase subunit